jgi:protein-L-isoaspartate(D-aspartate) O-methyltransferase
MTTPTERLGACRVTDSLYESDRLSFPRSELMKPRGCDDIVPQIGRVPRNAGLHNSLLAVIAAALFCIGLLAWPFAENGLADDAPASTNVWAERVAERRHMVDAQFKGITRTSVTDPSVIKAMLKVPRHAFVPESKSAYAYDDSPVPIGHGQTISQPYIVALMTQGLDLAPGMKVLEVGTGSGYQAAILAEITPSVFTIEIIRPLYESARERLERLGYATVNVRLGDGYHGLPEAAPFDRIIVTCASLHIPPPLIEQLKPGGRMVIPVGGAYELQRLLLVTKDEAGRRTSSTLELVRFVPLVRGQE